MIIKKFINSYGEITALCRETNYLWIGYIASGLSRLRKVSIFNPDLVYYDISVSGTRINKIIDSSDGYIYLSMDSEDNIGATFYKTNPIGAYGYYIKTIGMMEDSVDLITDTTYVYFLIPGTLSGTNAKIVKYNKSTRIYSETIDLTTVNNAKKIDIDYYGNLWVESNLDSVPILTKIIYSDVWSYTNYILS